MDSNSEDKIDKVLLRLEDIDNELKRMYKHNTERFGETGRLTRWLTGLVLVATGMSGLGTLEEMSDCILISGGLLIIIGLPLWWKLGEWLKKE